MAEGFFDTAQICRNGHVVNDSMKRFPEGNAAFCSLCGEATMTDCEGCHAPLRGYYQVPGVIGYSERQKRAPSFCHHCGRAYPWTERWLEVTREMAGELAELAEPDRELLRRCLQDLVREGPATELAAVRARKLLKKLGQESFQMMKTVMQDQLSESARKTLFGL